MHTQKTIAVCRAALFFLGLLPALYVFFAIQYSVITVPFWDHTELIKWVAASYDGKFEISSLWAPHNHTRPLVYRAVMLVNARFTDWDLRSEYVYLSLAILGVSACHFWALRRIAKSGGPMVLPASLLVVSLLIFSPTGHNNHWWSMMFQFNAANLFIALGMLAVFLNPHRWTGNLIGALACWLAAYTLTYGVIAFFAVILTLQITRRNVLMPGRWTIFWIINFVVLIFMYLPGLPPTGGNTHPGIASLVWFSLAYLGMPLAGIIWFPFKRQFDIPLSTVFSGLCGCLVVFSTVLLIWHGKRRLRHSHPAALILVGFTLFAVVSSLVTAWGRSAFDEYGISNANSSRYTMFGVYLLLGQIYYLTAGFAEGWLGDTALARKSPKWNSALPALAIALFVLLSGITYIRATHVYVEAHEFNKILRTAYLPSAKTTDLDKFIHPNPEFVVKLKKDLLRLRLGPYRNPEQCVESAPVVRK